MDNKVFRRFLGLILAITAAATLASTQADGAMGGFQEQFLEIKRKQLGPELGVSQQTVDRLLQIEQRYQDRRRKIFQESRADFKRLRQAIFRPSPSEPQVKAILNDIRSKLQESQNLHQLQIEEEERLLTPVQLARNILYHKKLLREARSVKGRSSRRTAPFTPPSGPREVQVSRKAGNAGGSAGAYQDRESPLVGQQARLQQTLRVDRQTVTQLLRIRQHYRPLRQQLIGEAKTEFQRLEEEMRHRNPSNQEVKRILANIKQKEQEMQGLKQRQDEEEMAVLSPVQQARYLMFLIALRRGMNHEPRSHGPRSLGPPANGGFGTRPARNAPPGSYPVGRPGP